MAHPVGTGGSVGRPTTPITVDAIPYDPAHGVATWWDDETILRAEVWDAPERTVVISGNPAGLRSLARHLLTLAQNGVPDGRHFDFDSYCGWLEEGSTALRIEVEKK